MIRSRLATIMAERDIRQDEMARDIGISKATLSNIANNRTAGLQYSTIEKIAIYLNLSLENLFDFSPYMFEFSIGNGTNEIEIQESEIEDGYSYKAMDDFGRETPSSEFPITYFNNGEITIISRGMSRFTKPLHVSIEFDNGAFPERHFDPVIVPTISDNFNYVVRVGIENADARKIHSELPFAFQKQLNNQIIEFIKLNYVEAFKKAGFSGELLLQIFYLSNQEIINI